MLRCCQRRPEKWRRWSEELNVRKDATDADKTHSYDCLPPIQWQARFSISYLLPAVCLTLLSAGEIRNGHELSAPVLSFFFYRAVNPQMWLVARLESHYGSALWYCCRNEIDSKDSGSTVPST